jgi:hypothetical protein
MPSENEQQLVTRAAESSADGVRPQTASVRCGSLAGVGR